jgi:hypothetical protein
MDRPSSLVGKTVEGAHICEKWELRVTGRCLDEDLNAAADAGFEAIGGLEIIKAFTKDRFTEATSSRQVSPLTSGREVWRLGYGDDHRGATLYDANEAVIWLVAYGRHRSGQTDDFFPYCKQLDADGRLLPVRADYDRMFRERDRRFVHAVRIEAPVILCQARATDGEYRCKVGGELGAGISIEVDDELDATAITVAFMATDLETIEQSQVLLAALSVGEWEMIPRMPSRDLEPGEVAFTVTLVEGQAT